MSLSVSKLMIDNNFSIIEKYFHKALALPLDARFEFITQSLPDQPEIQKAVISLLQHTQETQLLKQIAGKATHSVFDDQQDLSGTMAGAYKLIQYIETGGMGAVYIAERADKQYEKKVAVKLIKSINTSDYLLTRFMEERQILANLEHHNITRLADGGTTDAGVPFLVMEYVEGIPIDQYCEQNQLTLKQSLRLFIKVCEAIQYAHQNLVVHCDIKPENILVNQDGEPKVMDFGISHLLNKTELDTDTPRMLTIQYASPEQISGGIISVSSDIYALGAVLYKMLSGAGTFPASISNKDQVLDYIHSQKVVALSEQVSHRELAYYKNMANVIGLDLDAIVAKALQAKSSDRYSSASDFAEDITRLLTQKPVQARPANWPHRSYLFVRRNALSVTLGAVLGVSVLSASATIWYQSTQVELQRDIAQQERDSAQTEQKKAQAVTNFIIDMFKSIDPDKAQGNEVTVYDVLQSAIEKLKDPEQSTLTEQPMVIAKIRHTIGDMFMRIGKMPEAIEQLELADRLHQANTGEDIGAHISTLNALSNAYSRVDRHSDRGPILEAIAERAYELYGKEHIRTIGYALNLGGYYNDTGQHQRAIDTHLLVLEDAKRYLGEQSYVTVLALASLGNNYLQYGDTESALSYFLEALALAKEALGDKHTLVIYILERLVTIYINEDAYELSKPFAEELFALTDTLLGQNHQDTHRAQYLYAKLLSAEQRYTECLEILNKSLQTLPALIGEDHINVINTKSFKAETLLKLSLHQEAIALSLEVIEKMTEKYGADNDETLFEHHKLASVYKASGDLTKAHEVLRLVLPKWQGFTANTPSDIESKARSLYYLHMELFAFELTNNQALTAISSLQKAIEVARKNPEQNYPSLAANIRQLISLIEEHMPTISTQDYVDYLQAVELKAT